MKSNLIIGEYAKQISTLRRHHVGSDREATRSPPLDRQLIALRHDICSTRWQWRNIGGG